VDFSFDVPLDTLKPGTYICQVNVVDDTAGTFIFPRLALKVVAPTPVAAPATPAAPASTPPASAGN